MKKVLKNTLQTLFFKIKNLGTAKQIILLGIAFGTISLFFPWILRKNTTEHWNAFSALAGNNGYILITFFVVCSFFIISNTHKDNIRLHANIHINTYVITFITALLAFLGSFFTLSISVAMQSFSENIVYGQGTIFCIIAAVLMIIGGLMLRKEELKHSSEIILAKMSKERQQNKKQENMELPI